MSDLIKVLEIMTSINQAYEQRLNDAMDNEIKFRKENPHDVLGLNTIRIKLQKLYEFNQNCQMICRCIKNLLEVEDRDALSL